MFHIRFITYILGRWSRFVASLVIQQETLYLFKINKRPFISLRLIRGSLSI